MTPEDALGPRVELDDSTPAINRQSRPPPEMQNKQIVQTPHYAAYEIQTPDPLGNPIAIFLDERETDAAPGRSQPVNVSFDQTPDEDGCVNYFAKASEKTEDAWKSVLGRVLARDVVRQDVRKQGDVWRGDPSRSMLAEFPTGYQLYTHRTGDPSCPRTDEYLYGSESVHCFRSPQEFAEHTVWLAKGRTTRCHCCYCDKSRTQTEISEDLRLRAPAHVRERRKSIIHKMRSRARRPKSPIMVPKDYTKLDQAPVPGPKLHTTAIDQTAMVSENVPYAGHVEAEREMTRNQRGLVDDCFEEGQYEAGLAVLDQLRSPNYRPYAPHIRQLLYMALYPPPPEEGTRRNETDDATILLGSPSKPLSFHQRAAHIPPRAASAGALALLNAFAHTNTPRALLRALPSYPGPSLAQDAHADGADADDADDSFIARRAARIRTAKDCWALLRAGFVPRDADAAALPRKRGVRRPRAADELPVYAANGLPANTADADAPAPVGPCAWPVLDWMLSLFEKDERATARDGQPPHSPLLLAAIPAPRTHGPRWDVEAPLDVLVHALQQCDARRRRMGARLLALIANLAATTLVDLPLVLYALANRVLALPPADAVAALAALPPTAAALQFKLALCKSCLAGAGTGVDGAPARDGRRPKPQARAQPRPVPARRKFSEARDGEGSAAASEAGPVSIPRIYPALAPREILDLVGSPSSSASALLDLYMKMELVETCHILRKVQPSQDGQDEWNAIVRDGALREALEAAFSAVAHRDAAVNSRIQRLGALLAW
ncbi:hypothetical protein WOLCODRAFT_144682 [Wolfiporia cocos MD-104 SS10]|uniref:Cryptic loci regulator 2 N-terminal domain-containing protein n=1 Tax=Wolfiporia cocos (strain MD-104) TaxID=742152 RepID=A0A2H3JNK7_WOLCO|nr:hypothetical protein WOLCODRAFT_144682 [Wolfiporia cocos MD-104 SS10]